MVPLGPSQVLVDVLVDSPTALHQSRKSIAGPRHETLSKRTPSPFQKQSAVLGQLGPELLG